jgi:hypothetical protein
LEDSSGNWPKLISFIAGVIKTAVKVLVTQVAYASSKNIASSKKSADYKEVDKFLENRTVEANNVKLPVDTTGLMYNKENRIYASKIIKEDLGPDTKRTISDISSEIFAHQFIADMAQPLSILSGKVSAKLDIYGRLAKADIDEGENRIEFFDFLEAVFEWE